MISIDNVLIIWNVIQRIGYCEQKIHDKIIDIIHKEIVNKKLNLNENQL